MKKHKLTQHKVFALFIFLQLSTTVFGQKFYRPNKVGLTKEFTGWVVSYYQYDGDIFFVVKDARNIEIELYFNAGSCHMDGDPYRIETNIDEQLLQLIENTENGKKSKIKVKVIAKSTYGLFCGNCDDCTTNKQKIWRPINVTQIK